MFCCLVLRDLQLPSQFSVTGSPDMWQRSVHWRMTDSPLLFCFYNEKWTHSGTQLIDLDSLNVSIHMWGAWWNFHYHQWRFGGHCQRVCKTDGPSMLCGSSLSGIHEIVHVSKQSHKIVERTKATPNGLWSLDRISMLFISNNDSVPPLFSYIETSGIYLICYTYCTLFKVSWHNH